MWMRGDEVHTGESYQRTRPSQGGVFQAAGGLLHELLQTVKELPPRAHPTNRQPEVKAQRQAYHLLGAAGSSSFSLDEGLPSDQEAKPEAEGASD